MKELTLHTAAIAASLQPHSSLYSDPPSPQSRVKFRRSTPLHVHDADRVTGRKSWAWESEARSAQTQLWFVMMSHTNMLVHAITICWLCLWKWPRGFSHSNWGVKKFSDVANEVENTQTLRLQNYIHERLCSDDESTHFIVVGGLSNIKRWCSNSGGSFPQKIHSAQTNYNLRYF